MGLFLSIGEAMVELSRVPGQERATDWRLGYAGDTLNTAWYFKACRPGWDVEYLTRVGNDPFSADLLDFLQVNNIGTRFIGKDDRRSIGLYAIHLDKGERSFTYWRGQSAARRLMDDPFMLDAAFEAANAIYLSGVTLAILSEESRKNLLERFEAAREGGKLTAFDPNIRPTLWESADAMCRWVTAAAKAAEIVLPSFDDEAKWFGDVSPDDCALRWASAGAGEVVVKNGGGPITVFDGRELSVVPVIMKTPIDSAGAGDSFNGGYLAGRMNGLSTFDSIERAHRVSIQVISKPGALVPIDVKVDGLG